MLLLLSIKSHPVPLGACHITLHRALWLVISHALSAGSPEKVLVTAINVMHCCSCHDVTQFLMAGCVSR